MSTFSLEKDPFPQAGSGAFYFSTPALAARLDELRAALERRHVLLVDEAGSGKSTTLDKIVETADEGTRIVRLQGREQRCAKDIVHELVSGLGLPPREPAAAELRDADTLLELLAGRSQRVLIVVDDAHRMENGSLEQLLYLARRWERFHVRFLVAGEPALLEKLDSLPEAGGFPGGETTLGLPRLDDGQVSDYLHMCLFRAGLAGDSPFDASLVASVAEASRGLVGAIDPVARELLDTTERPGRGSGTASGAPLRRWPLGLVAVAGLGVLLTVALPGTSTSVEEVKDRVEVFRSSITLEPGAAVENGRRRSASADAFTP